VKYRARIHHPYIRGIKNTVEEFVILKNIFRNSGQNIDQEMRIHEQNSLLVENNETLANNTGKGHTICNNLRFIL